MNKQLILASAFAILTFASCKKGESTDAVSDVTTELVQNSADLIGVYSGLLPCASCPGIETTYEFYENGTYGRHEKYLNHPGFYNVRGKFTLSEDQTFFILDDVDQTKLKLKDGKLVLLTAEGKEAEGNLASYYQLALASGLKEYPQERYSKTFKAISGVNYTIVVWEENEKTTAYVTGSDGSSRVLKQTDAKGNGVLEWGDDEMTLTATDDEFEMQLSKVDQKLVLLSPLSYQFKDGNEVSFLNVTYYTQAEKPYVVILEESTYYVLPQLEASAKGAVYSDEKNKWITGVSDKATFVKKEVEKEYKPF